MCVTMVDVNIHTVANWFSRALEVFDSVRLQSRLGPQMEVIWICDLYTRLISFDGKVMDGPNT